MGIFEALASSARVGFAYYEWRRDFHDGEVDFVLWIRGLGRVALQVKGGHYELVEGEFHLQTWDGPVRVATSPLDEAWLGALDLHDDIREKAGVAYDPFVVPILALPDMEPDADIARLANRKRVHLVWRCADVAQAVADVLRSQPVRQPLTWLQISAEVSAVTDELIDLADAGKGPCDGPIAGPSAASVHSTARPKLLRINVAGVPVITARAGEIVLRARGPPD